MPKRKLNFKEESFDLTYESDNMYKCLQKKPSEVLFLAYMEALIRDPFPDSILLSVSFLKGSS